MKITKLVSSMMVLGLMVLPNVSFALPKCVLVIKHAAGKAALSPGQKVNAAAVLGATVGALFNSILGQDLKDASGKTHPGISTLPITVVKQPEGKTMNELYSRWSDVEGITVRGLTSDTSTTNNYKAYSDKLENTPSEAVDFYGVVIVGEEEAVKELTPKESFKLL